MNCKQYQEDLKIRAANDVAAQQTQAMLQVGHYSLLLLLLTFDVIDVFSHECSNFSSINSKKNSKKNSLRLVA
jgi:hypothetical protein